MEVTASTSSKTGRITGVLMQANSFEEERFLTMMLDVFTSGKGKIVAKAREGRITWMPTNPATEGSN